MSKIFINRIATVAVITTVFTFSIVSENLEAQKIKLRLASSGSATGNRAIALEEKFRPAVESFAEYEPHWNATLFKQGTELEAIARGNLEMALASAQELSEYIPEFSIFASGYVHRDPEHQVRVFNDKLMNSFKKQTERKLKLKLLTVMYHGTRQVNLRTDNRVMTPDDMKGIQLRMPGNEAWQFLGKSLGASPVPMAFSEIYTALQTGAVDGQDNPLSVVKDKKLYEVTKQIVLTSHLVDLNYIAISTKTWNKLSKKQRDTVQKAAESAADRGREIQIQQEKELVDFLKDKGMQVYKPNVNAFRDQVLNMTLKSKFSKDWPKGLIEKINKL